VLNHINFSIKSNEIFGLIGPNGAGKTTLCKIITGYKNPSYGVVRFKDKDVNNNNVSLKNTSNNYIGICPQNDILWNELNAIEHLNFFSKIKGIPSSYEKQLISKCMNNVGIKNRKKNNIKYMSGGEKRRLSLALSLLGNPKIIILDEPTTGIDPLMRNNLWKVISNLKQNKAILLVIIIEEANVLCNRIGIIIKGSMKCIGSPLELK
ncbi:P-loop containing nucleoside triphosphate hydrolase protein, partial [Anaeromyces robustus]